MSRKEQFLARIQYVVPKHLISRLAGRLAAARAGWLTQLAIRAFIRRYQVDMSEAAEPEVKAYKSFNAFFTRPLAESARPLKVAANQLCQPVDGTVSQAGPIEEDSLLQAKGHHFSLTELLGGQPEDAQPFRNGQFATIYLAPRDYHRIHMPIAGTLTRMVYVPGDLFSVNPLTARQIPGLFSRNERVIAFFEGPKGPFAMVLVGATIVGSMETQWAGTITPPRGSAVYHWDYPAQGHGAVHLEQATEMGRFKLGSTVILVFPQGQVTLDEQLQAGRKTRLGEKLGQFN